LRPLKDLGQLRPEEDGLDDPRPIPPPQEEELARGALVVQPTPELHLLAHVFAHTPHPAPHHGRLCHPNSLLAHSLLPLGGALARHPKLALHGVDRLPPAPVPRGPVWPLARGLTFHKARGFEELPLDLV